MRRFLLLASLFTLCLLATGLIVTFVGAFPLNQQLAPTQKMASSVGIITRLNCNNNIRPCVPVVRFTAKNKETVEFIGNCCTTIEVCVLGRCSMPKEVAIGDDGTGFEVGQQVTVLYNPNNFQDAQVQPHSLDKFSFQTSQFFGVGITLLLVGLLCATTVIVLSIVWLVRKLMTRLAIAMEL